VAAPAAGRAIARFFPMPRRLLHATLPFLGLAVLWVLFTDTLRTSELMVGIPAAALATLAMESVRSETHPRFLPRVKWIVEFWRIPFQIAADCRLITRAMARLLFTNDHRTGTFESVPFPARGRDAQSVAKRALAILYTTLPPNTIVIGIDRKRDVMLIHRLEPTGGPGITPALESNA
jgi:multisubunit Na+/H+ antiporter MnhE subunit